MALTTDDTPALGEPALTALVDELDLGLDRTGLVVGGETVIEVPVVPDPAAARRWLRLLRRVDVVTIDADVADGRPVGRPVCSMRGAGHRLPATWVVSLPTALGLAQLGVPLRLRRWPTP